MPSAGILWGIVLPPSNSNTRIRVTGQGKPVLTDRFYSAGYDDVLSIDNANSTAKDKKNRHVSKGRGNVPLFLNARQTGERAERSITVGINISIEQYHITIIIASICITSCRTVRELLSPQPENDTTTSDSGCGRFGYPPCNTAV